jgi:hypothetical protein
MTDQQQTQQQAQPKPQPKPYSSPTLTDHGKVVEETRGTHGTCWELYGSNLGTFD